MNLGYLTVLNADSASVRPRRYVNASINRVTCARGYSS